MTPVEFHILSETGDVARLRYACRLVEQAYEQGQRCYVYADSNDQAKRMDDTLWTFRDQAFIPHEILSQDSPSHPRIVAIIGNSPVAPTEFQSLLINISESIPETFGSFTRVCEVVDADPQHKQLARERYRQYRDKGCQLDTKTL